MIGLLRGSPGHSAILRSIIPYSKSALSMRSLRSQAASRFLMVLSRPWKTSAPQRSSFSRHWKNRSRRFHGQEGGGVLRGRGDMLHHGFHEEHGWREFKIFANRFRRDPAVLQWLCPMVGAFPLGFSMHSKFFLPALRVVAISRVRKNFAIFVHSAATVPASSVVRGVSATRTPLFFATRLILP